MHAYLAATFYAVDQTYTLLRLFGTPPLTLQPDTVVKTPDCNASFICTSATRTIARIEWYCGNETSSCVDYNLEITFVDIGVGFGVLTFIKPSISHNDTTVMCRATFANGDTSISASAQLLIQGMFVSRSTCLNCMFL